MEDDVSRAADAALLALTSSARLDGQEPSPYQGGTHGAVEVLSDQHSAGSSVASSQPALQRPPSAGGRGRRAQRTPVQSHGYGLESPSAGASSRGGRSPGPPGSAGGRLFEIPPPALGRRGRGDGAALPLPGVSGDESSSSSAASSWLHPGGTRGVEWEGGFAAGSAEEAEADQVRRALELLRAADAAALASLHGSPASKAGSPPARRRVDPALAAEAAFGSDDDEDGGAGARPPPPPPPPPFDETKESDSDGADSLSGPESDDESGSLGSRLGHAAAAASPEAAAAAALASWD